MIEIVGYNPDGSYQVVDHGPGIPKLRAGTSHRDKMLYKQTLAKEVQFLEKNAYDPYLHRCSACNTLISKAAWNEQKGTKHDERVCRFCLDPAMKGK